MSNKQRPFLVRRNLRQIVGQTALRFGFGDIFAARRIVLVDLARRRIGAEAARLPYLNVDRVEEAVIDFYKSIRFAHEFVAAVRRVMYETSTTSSPPASCSASN